MKMGLGLALGCSALLRKLTDLHQFKSDCPFPFIVMCLLLPEFLIIFFSIKALSSIWRLHKFQALVGSNPLHSVRCFEEPLPLTLLSGFQSQKMGSDSPDRMLPLACMWPSVSTLMAELMWGNSASLYVFKSYGFCVHLLCWNFQLKPTLLRKFSVSMGHVVWRVMLPYRYICKNLYLLVLLSSALER